MTTPDRLTESTLWKAYKEAVARDLLEGYLPASQSLSTPFQCHPDGRRWLLLRSIFPPHFRPHLGSVFPSALIVVANGGAAADQLGFWPEHQRKYVDAVRRASVFVPSRGGFVPLMPGLISPDEMREAAEYLANKAEEITRVRIALRRLADMVDGQGSDD